jgi:hypothetical protein
MLEDPKTSWSGSSNDIHRCKGRVEETSGGHREDTVRS